MSGYAEIAARLAKARSRWLVTGAGGFIGSHLVEALLTADQDVVGLDNFITGHRGNLEEVRSAVSPKRWSSFKMIEGDIRDRQICAKAVAGAEYVLHQAALGSVPRSLTDPVTTHDTNVTGFLNVLDAAMRAGVRRFVFAASSSTYGDDPNLPKREERTGQPLSPYAVTKLVNELYAQVYARSYGFASIGLRYFNVFGARQDPLGPYAAVIPKWAAAMIEDQEIFIFGDGSSSRDFCYVANAVQANLRAALAGDEAQNQIFNVAVGQRTTLLELFRMLRSGLAQRGITYSREPSFLEPRKGDVPHSQAAIEKAQRLLGYQPTHTVSAGLTDALGWYLDGRAARPLEA